MLKKKNGKCPFGYVEFNGMCVPENQQSQFQFSNEFTSSNGYQPIPKPPIPPTPTPPGPGPKPDNGGKYDDTYDYLHTLAEITGTVAGVGLAGLEAERRYRKAKIDNYLREERLATELEASLPPRGSTTPDIDLDATFYGGDDMDAVVQDYFAASAAADADQVAIDIDPFARTATEDTLSDMFGQPMPDWLAGPPDAPLPYDPRGPMGENRFLINTDEEIGLNDITMEQLNEMTDAVDELYAAATEGVRTVEDGTETNFQRLSRQKAEKEAADTKAARERRIAKEEAAAAKAEEEAVAGPKDELDTRLDEFEKMVDDAEGAAAADDPFYGGDGFDVDGDGYGEVGTFGRDYDEIAKTEGELAPDANYEYGKPGNNQSDYGTDYGRTGTATGDGKVAQEAYEIKGYVPTDELDQKAYDLFKSKRAVSQAPPYEDTPRWGGGGLEDDYYADVPSLESLAPGGGGNAVVPARPENAFPDMTAGGELTAAETESAVAEAEKVVAAARATGAAVTVAEQAAVLARIVELAVAGEDAAVAAAIMTGLLSTGTASIGAIAAAGVEIAVMTAVTFGAEAIYKEIAGVKDRPDSLDDGYHEMTKEEAEYFQYVAQAKVDKEREVYANAASDALNVGLGKGRAPINPFAPNRTMVGGKRPSRLASERKKALYNEMSKEEKKVFDDNFNKKVADEDYSISVWNNIPAGTMIQHNFEDGYEISQFQKPNENTIAVRGAQLAENRIWIDEFNDSLKDVPVIDDGIGHAEPLDMGETYDYLAMMNQRNTDYLNSISEAQMSLPGSNGGGIYSAVLPDTGARLNLPDFGAPLKPGGNGGGIYNLNFGSGAVTPLPQDQSARARLKPGDDERARALSQFKDLQSTNFKVTPLPQDQS